MNTPFFLPTFTKFCCVLTGDDFHLLYSLNDPKSNKRIQLLAMLIFLPMLMWFITVLLIMKNVFENDWMISSLGAVIVAFIIGIVERSIIMSAGGLSSKLVRLFLAFVLAAVGSFFIDEIFFEKDINEQIASSHRQKIAKLYQEKSQHYDQELIQKKRDEVKKAETDWIERMNEVSTEAGGLRGTGIRGAGAATKVKNELAEQAKLHYDKLNAELKQLIENKPAAMAHYQKEIQQQEQGKTNGGLMYKIGAMFELIFSKWYMLAFWIAVTFVFLLIEVLPVTMKWSTEKDPTFYERLVEYRSSSPNTLGNIRG